jgi:transcriptional regulator with XRE-family HTH domain
VPRSLHSPDYQKLIAILLDARRKAGVTQQQVADRLGKPQSYVAKVEGAERRIDVVEFISLAKAIGIDPTSLFHSVVAAVNGTKNSRR